MKKIAKPIVVVSECLEITSCRWDGKKLEDKFVRLIKSHCTIKPICPELGIGLSVPRDPVRLVQSDGHLTLAQPTTGKEMTAQMHQFSREFLSSLKEVDGFILKNRSPSCGIRDTKVYRSVTAKHYFRKNSGLFAINVRRAFPALPIEDEHRLEDSDLRDHFLTKLFTLASFRSVLKLGDPVALARFHKRNQLLFGVYNQSEKNILDLVVGALKQNPSPMLWGEYERHLHYVLARRARYTSNAKAMVHCLEQVPSRINGSDRRRAKRLTEQYTSSRHNLPLARSAVRELVFMADNKELSEQTWLTPYPTELGK